MAAALDPRRVWHGPPSTIQAAQVALHSKAEDLRSLLDLLPSDQWSARLVVDTNALIDDPDLSMYQPHLGTRYMVHLLPVVLRELDDQEGDGPAVVCASQLQ